MEAMVGVMVDMVAVMADMGVVMEDMEVVMEDMVMGVMVGTEAVMDMDIDKGIKFLLVLDY